MAPNNLTKKPSQYKQSSRKGKKAWRKNIDLSDVEQYMEKKIDHEITHGTSDITSLQNDALFHVDVEGDEVLKKKLIKRKQIKKVLKSKEILDAVKTNSKIAALNHHKNSSGNPNKIQGVSKHELKKLMALAGRVHGESKIKNRVAKDGLVKTTAGDLWGEESNSKKQKVKLPSGIKLDVEKKDQVPEELLKKSTTSWSIASVRPSTLDIEPIAVKEFTEIPHAGKSYNPNNKAWSELINKEYKEEKAREDERIALEKYKERIRHLMETLDDNEEEESSSNEEEENENENESTQCSGSDKEVKLSINKPVKNKKKTKYQRNKAKRHEEKVKSQQELKELRQRVKDLEEVINSEETQILSAIESDSNKIKKSKKNKKHKLGTKYSVIDERLEIKFSDELSDSLRKLKPEGNLLYDTVRKLQSSGKVETRVPVRKGRKYKQKITEKWTHKDFK
ncbi:CEI_1a_G0053510.mRNA.1.CDS.1 [Saccharomyces cerevisiae]|nr:EM14S01-3B_G0017890.mRNA.1.CDS.1 [Saccharomyces cerevisiae]CAI4823886.1 CEI_1a_G0053510.mRNA.1.CDS.1 [Saccharomyces cerevisiae]CAI4831032.1 AMH_1a_G0053640.mRNA.1.CDS.1 [Saccharomyces cerevisiae]CAI6900618.1 AMH_1a_G0053640.mRNA.1.CDS.1 [Saccharomyces cerevisiae]CAI7476452.1 CEI_1a_G0053510.mRNA.1.CDS.1 [Saccharomyces cerevisiae]